MHIFVHNVTTSGIISGMLTFILFIRDDSSAPEQEIRNGQNNTQQVGIQISKNLMHSYCTSEYYAHSYSLFR